MAHRLLASRGFTFSTLSLSEVTCGSGIASLRSLPGAAGDTGCGARQTWRSGSLPSVITLLVIMTLMATV